ncbi:MAG: hypothetical protein ACI9J3_001091 [Parvicellaceae bacterium]|jgi:hypothetical protein
MMKKLNKIPFRIRLKYGYYQFFDHFLTRPRFFNWTRKGRTRFYRKLENRLEQTGEGTLTPVDRVKDISRKDFFKNYVKKGIPVIMEGKAADWKCVQEWSLEYFKELHGDDEIVFLNQRDINVGDYEQTTLGKVIDTIREGGSKYYRFYPLLTEHPEHLLDFDYEWLKSLRRRFAIGEAFHVFISGKGGFTPIHNANSENIFTQIYGEKKWVLYPMEATCVVDPPPTRNFYRSALVKRGKDFDPFERNFEDFPLYKHINGYSAHLKPGDVFYNPPYMWHAVKNPTDSIGVGYRYFTPAQTFFKYPLYFGLELFAFNPPIWKSWKRYGDINLLHLMETKRLKKLEKERGEGKITDTVKSKPKTF